MIQKICEKTGLPFEVSDLELKFFKKMGIKEPKYHPKIREAMRMALRNDRNFYMRTCDKSGERILSIYSQDHPFPVYKYEHWMAGDWEPPGMDYDFARPFFDQYAELSRQAPRPNLFTPYNENCDYVNAAEKNKNCYMHILSDRSEDCYYTHGIFACRDCIDSAYIFESELCYECVDGRILYHCRMCFLCDNCSNCNFCFDCRGCSDCFMSYGLRNQKYCINNEQFSKEEYGQKMSEIQFGSHKIFDFLKGKFIKEVLTGKDYIRLINTENSDGNFLINTKNCHHCYDVEDAEDCMYLRLSANGCKDVVDSYAVVDGSQLIYGNISTTEAYHCHNVIGCWTTKDSAYSEFLQGCQNCIGCISLRYKKFYVLNKQYSEDEFKKLKKHIINELGDYWGNPFPFEVAPFDYQDSTFRDYHTMSKEEVERVGWRYGEKNPVEAGDFESVAKLPDAILDAEDEISGVFLCEKSKRPFKIIPQEIRLLKTIVAPLPRYHHEVRFQERVKFRKN